MHESLQTWAFDQTPHWATLVFGNCTARYSKVVQLDIAKIVQVDIAKTDTPYVTKCLVTSLPNMQYVNHVYVYMVLANPR